MASPLEELIAAIGSEQVLTDEDARFRASLDNLRLSFMPEAVVRPRHEDDVAAMLKLANAHQIPVTARGAGSATTGSAAPVKGGWALDMAGWKQFHIDTAAGLAYVQPGVVTGELRAAAEAEGWFYPPDPSSLKYCTIGGNIACNAGGMSGAKYGVTRDYVMGLEGFLPGGEWVRWAGDLKKFASGYNMRDLWVGSEGTLGVITGAVLKLVPKPETRSTFLYAFANEREALAAVRTILEARLVPSILEFLDQQSVDCTFARLREDAQQSASATAKELLDFLPAESSVLLIELDGRASAVDEDRERLRELVDPLALKCREASSPAEAETLWAVRRRCSQAMFRYGDTKLNEDVVVPLAAQVELLEMTLEVKARTGLATPTFGHAADGNFHVHVIFNRKDSTQREKAEEAVRQIMEKVVALGGAISGEHGIGLAKSPFLELQHGKAEIAAMRAVKQALDPNNILNPGKIFEPFRVWEHEPVEIRMPWDH